MKIAGHMRELYSDYRLLEKQERLAVRRVNIEERNQYNQFIRCLRQMLVDQGSLMVKVDCFDDLVESLDRPVIDLARVGGEEDDRLSYCSSLRSLRSLSTGSSRSQSPVCGPECQPVVLRRDRGSHCVSNKF